MSADTIPQGFWDHEVTAMTPPALAWLWHGFVATGNVTLLTSMWKAGKTTLLSLLLARRKQGGPLAGLPVKPGKTVVVTEEPPDLWADRAHRLDFGGQVYFIPRPFLGIPRPEQWQELLDHIVDLRWDHGIDLAVFDPLAPFLRGENQPQNIFEALLPLRALTRQDMAVMLLHHPAKGARHAGHAARGSGALLGHVDISIEMRHPGGDPFTRRRRFLSLSRYADTPRQLFLELDADSSDYLPVAQSPANRRRLANPPLDPRERSARTHPPRHPRPLARGSRQARRLHPLELAQPRRRRRHDRRRRRRPQNRPLPLLPPRSRTRR